jgi:hypothetical protein
MKYAKWLLIVNSVLLCACGTMHTRVENLKNYSINSVQQANIGSSMLSNKVATVVEGKRWVGLLYSKDGWEHFKEYSDDSFMEELIYTGRSGNTIHISYREYKKDFARPAFFQELRYDIGQSTTIVFKQYKLKIIEATNEYIKFIVLVD